MKPVDTLPLLLGFLWYGFSLSFLVLAWIAWVDRLRIVESACAHVPFSSALRWGAVVLGMVGAFGAAGLVGLHREVKGVTWSFLAGVAIGTTLAVVLRKHLLKRV